MKGQSHYIAVVLTIVIVIIAGLILYNYMTSTRPPKPPIMIEAEGSKVNDTYAVVGVSVINPTGDTLVIENISLVGEGAIVTDPPLPIIVQGSVERFNFVMYVSSELVAKGRLVFVATILDTATKTRHKIEFLAILR